MKINGGALRRHLSSLIGFCQYSNRQGVSDIKPQKSEIVICTTSDFWGFRSIANFMLHDLMTPWFMIDKL